MQYQGVGFTDMQLENLTRILSGGLLVRIMYYVYKSFYLEKLN